MALIIQEAQKAPDADSARERKSGMVWAVFLHTVWKPIFDFTLFGYETACISSMPFPASAG